MSIRTYLWLSVLMSLTQGVQAQAEPDEADTTSPRLTNAREPTVMALLAERRDAFGHHCTVQALATSGDLRFVACGEAGLWIVRVASDRSAQVVTQQLFEGPVTAFAYRDGRLWFQVVSVRAHELALPTQADGNASFALEDFTLPKAPLRVPPAAARAEPPARGVVVALEPGFAIVDLGVAQGARLGTGDHVVLRPTRADDALYASNDPAVVGVVVDAGRQKSRVELGLNERVQLGASVERTGAELTGARFSPPRASAVWDVGFVAHGMLVLDDLGVGAFADAHVGYHFSAPVHLEARLAPIGIATARSGVVAPYAALLAASFDTTWFEAGLGGGAQSVGSPDISLDPGSGLTVALRLRLGARDGAHLETFAYMALFHSNFEFSQLRLQAQIPIAHKAWLRAALHVGNMGLSHAELGLRLLTAGNGGPGSFFLDTVIGGANFFRGCEVRGGVCSIQDYGGPTLGMGGEWRL